MTRLWLLPRPALISQAPAVPRPARLRATLMAAVLVLGGCRQILQSPPAATPADFPGIAGELGRRGLAVTEIVSGDAGCPDQELARTAIRFEAAGLDQERPVTIYVYIFRDAAAYDRRRQSVDTCARSYITDAQQLGSIDAAPFVLVGQGPWATGFTAALREGMAAAAGRP